MAEIKQHTPRGRPLSTLSLKIMGLLDDGEWHEYGSIVEEAMLVTPPGEAYRIAEKSRTSALRRQGRDPSATPRLKNVEYGEIVAFGQRAKATATIHSLCENGRVQKRDINGKKSLRLIRPTPRMIYLINENGERSLHYYAKHVVVTEIDLRALTLASKAQLEAKLEELSTFPERFPKVMELRKTIQSMINERNIDRFLIDYSRDV
jgi:hypothetical protein